MIMKENTLKVKSFSFAIDSINLYKTLKLKNEYVLGKPLLCSGTSVGANIREANNAQSKADVIQKECDETRYWLELLKETDSKC